MLESSSTSAVKRARRSVAISVARSPSSLAARTESTSTGGASTAKRTCVAEPSSSTTIASISIRGRAGSAVLGVREVLRPDPEDDGARLHTRGASVGPERDPEAGELDRVARDLGLDEVHRRRADERGDEEVERLAVEGLRRVDLLHGAVAHHRHPGAERHRLDLVVGDVDRRDPEPVVQPRQLGAHVDAELGVQVRQRLVHQERLRLAHDRPAHGDPLALAAGERARPALEQILQPEQPGDLLDAALDLGFRRLAHLQPVAEILRDRHVRVQGVVLEDHRDVAVPRRESRHLALADPDVTLRHLSRPAIIRSSVDLPQPDGPTRTMNSPLSIVRLTSSTARTSPSYTFPTCSSLISDTCALLTSTLDSATIL
jgi:hypothetical protein